MSGTLLPIRLFVESPLKASAVIELGLADSHYIANVMRANAGDEILLFNGLDGEWQANLEILGKKKTICRATKQTRPQVKEPDLWFVFAPIKKARLDFVAQKATELGVSKILPVKTERTIISRVKGARLHANAKEAAEQCERLTIPVIEEFQSLKSLLAKWPNGRKLLFCDEEKGDLIVDQALKGNDVKPARHPWGVLIGPEGGFSDLERQLIRSQPFCVPASLGPRVLRADTAGMAALTLWQAALGDW